MKIWDPLIFRFIAHPLIFSQQSTILTDPPVDPKLASTSTSLSVVEGNVHTKEEIDVLS